VNPTLIAIPSQVEVVLLNHPEVPSSDAGEPSSRNVPAAIANAVFDATSARVRQMPLTPARVKAVLAAIQDA
jgi:CO/xanthine dehydrogenase Mo-binding subunit